MRAIAVLGIPLLLSAGPAPADPATRYELAIALDGTRHFRGEDGQTTEVGRGNTALAVGETGYAYVGVGIPERPESGLCNDFTGSSPGPREFERAKAEYLPQAADSWWATFTPAAAPPGRVSFDVSWERWRRESGSAPSRVATGRRRIDIEEGGSHVFDFVAMDPGPETYCSRNVTVRFTGKVAENPHLEGSRLSVDLWFRHTDAAGRTRTSRFQTTAVQGENVEFATAPLRFPVPQSDGRGNGPYEVIVECEGQLRARRRPDGMLDVSLSAVRWSDMEKAGTPRRGGSGITGERRLTVKPGETVALPYPAASGRAKEPPFELDLADFFRGHRDELILTVTPLD